MQKNCSQIGQNQGDFDLGGSILGVLCPFRVHLSRGNHQVVAHMPQVHQREQHLQPHRYLGQTPVAHLGESKLAFNHPKRMLHSGTQAGLGPFAGFQYAANVAAAQRAAFACAHGNAHGNVPLHVAPQILFTGLNTSVAGIAQNHSPFTVQQCVSLSDIADVRSRAHDRMHQAGRVHTDMALP